MRSVSESSLDHKGIIRSRYDTGIVPERHRWFAATRPKNNPGRPCAAPGAPSPLEADHRGDGCTGSTMCTVRATVQGETHPARRSPGTSATSEGELNDTTNHPGHEVGS